MVAFYRWQRKLEIGHLQRTRRLFFLLTRVRYLRGCISRDGCSGGEIGNRATGMICVCMPVEQTIGRLIHFAAAARTTHWDSLNRFHRHMLIPVFLLSLKFSTFAARLHNTPDATNFAKGDAYFSERFATRIPAIIRYRQ